MSLYFAYGSNMDAAQIRKRCPGATLLGPAELPGYRFGIAIRDADGYGYADIIEEKGNKVYGLLYEIGAEDLAALDRYEGVPTAYRRIAVMTESNGAPVSAEAYEVVHKSENLVAKAGYMLLIEAAALLHGFPEPYRAHLASFPRR